MAKAILLCLLLVLCARPAFANGFFNFGVNGGVCLKDGEIPAAQRKSIETIAMTFVQDVLTNNSVATYSMLTKEAQSHSPQSELAAVVASLNRIGPYSNPHVDQTYMIQSVGSGPDATSVCGLLANSNWVAVAIKPGLTQAHVEVIAQTRNNDIAFNLWLIQNGSGWLVQTFHGGMSGVLGVGGPDALLALARRERHAGHTFSAAMLYIAVELTMDRGPSFQLGIAQTVRDDLKDFAAPAEIAGKPPFALKLKDHVFKVSHIGILGVQKELGLTFDLPQTSWGSLQDIDAKNRVFLIAFIAEHPEWSKTFGFLVARAMKPDNSGGFGTVYTAATGFNKAK